MYPGLAPLVFEPYIGADTLELRHAVQRRRRMHARDAGRTRREANGVAETPCRTVAEFKRRLLEAAVDDFGFGQEWL
jgi:hypothetical protein